VTWSGYHLEMKSRQTFPISEFKAKCIAIMRRVHRTKTSVIVTVRGKPLASIDPICEPSSARKLGGQQHAMTIHGDIVGTDLAGEWESLAR
jgi:prevent-host-death family protein